MFDLELAEFNASATMSLTAAAHGLVLEQECLVLRLAAHWCDLHAPDSQTPPERQLPGAEQARVLGGDGTPAVLEFAAAEFGAIQETTAGSARSMMADALDLRHRLPELWRCVLSGQVRVWQARKVAQATRHLSVDAARHVDQAVADALIALPWSRFETLLSAKIIEADPAAADERARLWEAERFVRAGKEQHGLKMLIARANAGDVICFLATVNRIAEILRLQGDLSQADVRRSRAIGALAQPALALDLLWQFRDEQRPAVEPQRPDEPVQNLPDAPADRAAADPGVDTDEPVRAARGGLIVRRSHADSRSLLPKLILHVHLSQEALLAELAHDSRSAGEPADGRTVRRRRGQMLGLASGGVARFEGVGPVTLEQVRRFLREAGCPVSVQPVIDPTDTPPVDSYEIPRRVRESMFLRMPASCFPYSASTSRRLDLDHTRPYVSPDRGGPPGQTMVGNLGPLTRTEHRIKTHGRWQVRQPSAGLWLWRSPHGAHYLVSNAGTQQLGDRAFARQVWQAAAQRAPTDERAA